MEVVLERGDYSINLEDHCSFGNLVQKCTLVFERGRERALILEAKTTRRRRGSGVGGGGRSLEPTDPAAAGIVRLIIRSDDEDRG